MIVLGLVGGIGSGKSEVARMLAQLGAEIVDADRIGHEMLLHDSVKMIARKRWGETIFNELGEIDRRRLAEIVFAQTEQGKAELEFLKNLTHPLIAAEFRRRVNILAQSGKQVVVLDAPLLFEANWNSNVTKIVFVDSPESLRAQRVRSRGWDADELRRRESTQWSIEKKRRHSDFCITNDGSLDHLKQQVETIWNSLLEKSNPQSTSTS